VWSPGTFDFYLVCLRVRRVYETVQLGEETFACAP